jgi:hypothetical protein
LFSRDQAAFDGKGTDAGQDVPAILAIGDDCLIDRHLEEEIIDVDPGPLRARHQRDFARERIRAPHSVDLAWIGRAHRAEQESVSFRLILRELVCEEEAAFRSAAAHPHAADAFLRHI